MQFGTPSPLGYDSGIHIRIDESSTYAPFGGFATDRDAESDGMLELLNGCIEAMSLLQAKFAGLEIETQIKLDAAARGIADVRSAVGTTQTEVEQASRRIADTERKVGHLQAGAAETLSRFEDEVASARADAATWRMRVETDSLGFEHLAARLVRLEAGVASGQDRATAMLAESEAEKMDLLQRADAASATVEQLQTRLREVEATIVDQRSRITCLQGKLATANYAFRLEMMSRKLATPGSVDERDILDLQETGQAMISAA